MIWMTTCRSAQHSLSSYIGVLWQLGESRDAYLFLFALSSWARAGTLVLLSRILTVVTGTASALLARSSDATTTIPAIRVPSIQAKV